MSQAARIGGKAFHPGLGQMPGLFVFVPQIVEDREHGHSHPGGGRRFAPRASYTFIDADAEGRFATKKPPQQKLWVNFGSGKFPSR